MGGIYEGLCWNRLRCLIEFRKGWSEFYRRETRARTHTHTHTHAHTKRGSHKPTFLILNVYQPEICWIISFLFPFITSLTDLSFIFPLQHIIQLCIFMRRSRDSSVGTAAGYGLDDRGQSSSPGRIKNFLFSTSSRPALGSTQPPIQWVPGFLPRE
jgi:hypothetical protein